MPNLLYFLINTSIISPVGNYIGNITSPGIFVDSLQWIRVSSKSKTIVFLNDVIGRFIFFSSIYYKLIFLAKLDDEIHYNKCSLIY